MKALTAIGATLESSLFLGSLAFIVPTGIAGMAIWLIILLAVVAIVYIAARAMGVAIPQWVI